MSIVGKCLGVAPEDLAAVLAAPEGVREFLNEASRRAKNDRRTGHEWHGLDRLVGNLGEPAAFAVVGDRPIGTINIKGYGPARYLPPETVAEVARVLSEWPAEKLRPFFSLEDFRDAEIYTFDDNDENEDQAWVRLRRAYESLVRFYQGAAASGEAVVCYLF